MQPNTIPQKHHVFIVTGLSGAGRTTVLKALEDLGCEVVDNLPLFLLQPILTQQHLPKNPVLSSLYEKTSQILALGIDARTRDFDGHQLLHALKAAAQKEPYSSLSIIYLDCQLDVLQRRFTETRRAHPLAQDRPVIDGLLQERHLLAPLREKADLILDSTHLTPAQLRSRVTDHLATRDQKRHNHLQIHLTSFSYKKGVPRDADLVMDVRFLQNPHYIPELRPLTGQDPAVGHYVMQDQVFEQFQNQIQNLFSLLLPRYQQEGKSYLTIAFGCTGGRHRSIFMTERIATWMINAGWHVIVSHRDTQTEQFEAPL